MRETLDYSGEAQKPFHLGTSLKELIPLSEKRYKGSGPRISERVVWLSQTMETPDFWNSLHHHLAENIYQRHSVGGVFHRKAGDKPIGTYTWHQIYTSLDSFMKSLGSSATEFLFRDFYPKKVDDDLLNRIEATRVAALDIFPRLRRLYWGDYQQALQTPSFWSGMIKDLQELSSPVSTNKFFDEGEVTRENKSDPSSINTHLEKEMVHRFMAQTWHIEQRAQFLDYRNVSQIIHDMFKQDPRSYFLNYSNDALDSSLQQQVAEAKSLIEHSILPVKPKSPEIPKMSSKEVKIALNSKEFWTGLTTDFDRHMQSSTPVYSLDYFLRYYDRNINEVYQGHPGNYAPLFAAFTYRKGTVSGIIDKPDARPVLMMMWRFQPNSENAEQVLTVKRSAVELFPRDCFYLQLQLPEFWEQFQKDLGIYDGNATFTSFLAHFNDDNQSADWTYGNKGRYEHVFHRSYSNPKELEHIIDAVGNTRSLGNLEALMYHYAPDKVKALLQAKFPDSFDLEAMQEKQRQASLLAEAKGFLSGVVQSTDKRQSLAFSSEKELIIFRSKIESAARSLNVPIRTKVHENTLIVEVRPRRKFTSSEIAELENQIEARRNRGMTNKEIATELGLEDYHIEYFVGRLIRSGKLQRRSY